MARGAPAVLLLALAAAGCRLEPGGTCGSRADCPAGLDCLSGVCAACREDAECAWWEACGLDGLCAPDARACEVTLGCCGADGSVPCCGDDGDCASWEACGADHVCATRPDHCPSLPCTAPYACDPAHHCSLPGGACLADADCPAWMAGCDAGSGRCRFPAAAGEDVLAVGTLAEGSCAAGAAARATSAAASSGVELGLGCGSAADGRAFLDPVTGELVYRFAEPAGADTLRRMRRDAMIWDAEAARWRFPAAPAENDDVALRPGAGCEAAIAWEGWVMQADTGALLYGCPIAGGSLRDYYDGDDVRRVQAVQEVLSWNGRGFLLVRSAGGVLQVLDASGIATSVTGLPGGELLARRATGTGFRVALRSDVTGGDALWEIDEGTALASPVGTYPDVAAAWLGLAWPVLDDGGALHGVGPGTDLRYEVHLRPLLPGATAVVYAEADMPAGANDPSAPVFEPFLRLDRPLLVTRP